MRYLLIAACLVMAGCGDTGSNACSGSVGAPTSVIQGQQAVTYYWGDCFETYPK